MAETCSHAILWYYIINSCVDGKCHLPCHIYKNNGIYSVKIMFVVLNKVLQSFNAYFNCIKIYKL